VTELHRALILVSLALVLALVAVVARRLASSAVPALPTRVHFQPPQLQGWNALDGALDDPRDREFVDNTMQIFAERGSRVCFVELEATQAERLRRNQTPLAFLLDADRKYRMNSTDAFFCLDRHVKIDNTALEPDAVARQIAARFALPVSEGGG
jgi:hypothetical protein